MGLHAIVVGDEANRDVVERFGFDWLWWSNDTMGAKWNAGFAYAADEGADLFVLIGSDNWIHPNAFSVPLSPEISAAEQLDFVDLERGVLQHAHGIDFIPWLIPRSLFEPVGFTPLPDRMQRGTEPMLHHALNRPPIVRRSGPPGVDFKSQDSTSPYAGVRNSVGDGVEHDMLSALSEHYPAHLVEAARLVYEESR